MRLLVGGGKDRSVFETSSRFDRRPAGKSWQKVAMEARGEELPVLDLAVRYGLVDVLCFDSLAAWDERAVSQLAEAKAVQSGLAGATKIATYDIDGDDARMVRVGLAAGHMSR